MFHVCFVVLSCMFLVVDYLGEGGGSLVRYVPLCFITFPYGILGKLWYLIALIPNICLLLNRFTCYNEEQS